MKKYLILIAILCATYIGVAQVTEINPRADWKYVRSQDLVLQDNSVYQFEFPADTGYEYLLNVTISEPNIETYMNVMDIQGKPIGKHAPNERREQMAFQVDASGTYIIALGYKGPEDDDGTTSVKVTLIRRPEVE
jgi:hypothetical protein